MDNKTKILIISPVILIIIFILMANSIHLKKELSGSEKQLLSVDITLKQLETKYLRQKTHVIGGEVTRDELKSPIDFNSISSVEGSFPPVALEALVPQMNYNGKSGLSLIIIGEKIRMAIIKGIVVKEGDSIDGMKIAKIEPNRVLLKNKTMQWLYLEKTK